MFSDLSPLFREWASQLAISVLQPVDFAGAVLLAYMAFRRPKAWINGRLSSPVIPLDEQERICNTSRRLANLPLLVDLLDKSYICKKFKVDEIGDLTLLHVFNQMRFANIKQNSDNYINYSMVYWYGKQRPYVLMFSIPTPMEVLRMQAKGTRVVTVFVQEEELNSKHIAKLHYMEGVCCELNL